MNIEQKRQNEYKTVLLMIRIFCRGRHKNRSAMKNPENLCEECRNLSEYVKERVEKCPFMETKTFCSACRVHCLTLLTIKKVKVVRPEQICLLIKNLCKSVDKKEVIYETDSIYKPWRACKLGACGFALLLLLSVSGAGNLLFSDQAWK
ncbi:nitrous oxide-stimulated promoter family protein [Treponema sp.]|uniref:nitrous oxide-stimulated promoter family protein n=1 Tax=Treponema sp. TaxID=166 RepID=UPI00388D43E8